MARQRAMRAIAIAFAAAFAGTAAAQQTTPEAAAETYAIRPVEILEEKAVFATVESADVTAARARIGGVVADLVIDEGDRVEAGQQVALIGDEKLELQLESLSSRIRSLEASRANAETELTRAQDLFRRGVVAKSRVDDAQTAFEVADGALESAKAERAVIVEQEKDGAVLAPAAGVVLDVKVTNGAVVLAGESLAEIASDEYVLRLSLPERHARFVKKGDPVRVEAAALSGGVAPTGEITRVYPQIENGRVLADAEVAGLGDFFVGERVRVLVRAGERAGFVAPERFIETRYGVDFVALRGEDGQPREVAVQRGRAVATASGETGVEILAGVSAGDVLVAR